MSTRLWQYGVLFVAGVGLIVGTSVTTSELASNLGIGLLASSIVLAVQLERTGDIFKFGWIVLGALAGCVLWVYLLAILS